MGYRPRFFEPNFVYNCVSRAVDRSYLFKPNHQKGNVLLADTCDVDALLINNDKIPKPSLINIIGSSIARAQINFPMQLFWLECNVNHPHVGVGGRNEVELNNIPDFFQNAKRLIAEQINKTWNREGHVFAGPYRAEKCLDAQEDTF